MDDENRVQINRAWWDERVRLHMSGEFYDIDGFLAGNGVDFSPKAILGAPDLASRAGIAAELAEASVHDPVDAPS